MSPNVNAIIFAKDKLTKISGRPSAWQIRNFKKEFIANAASINSAEFPEFGHAGMLMRHYEYRQYNGARGGPWREPLWPGRYPVYNQRMNAAMMETVKTRHENELDDYNTYMDGVKKLRQQFLETFEERYYSGVLQPGQNITSVHPNDLLSYMVHQYGEITWSERIANRKKLDAPWDETGSVEEMVSNFREIMEVHEFAGSRIHPTDVLDAIMVNLSTCADFQEEIRKLRSENASTWDFEAIVQKFKKIDHGRIDTTAGNSLYNSANAAEKAPAPATATATSPEKAATGGKLTEVKYGEYVMSYCHSCGFQFDRSHNSKTCQKKKPGHNDLATCWSQCGGCTDIVVPERYRGEPKPRGGKRQRTAK